MHESLVTCANCGRQVSTQYIYCSHCSQKLHGHRLSLGHLGHEVIHFLTHADKGIFHLIKNLAYRPGKVAREYVAGKRKTWFSPLNFFLIIIGVFVFVNSNFNPMEATSFKSLRASVNKIPNEEVRNRRLAKVERMEKAVQFMSTKSNYVNMAMTPLIAFLFFVIFYKRGYNYTEHLVANLYFAGFAAIFFIVIIAPLLIFTKGTVFYYLGILMFLIFEAIYRSIAYYQFLNRKGTRQFLFIFFISLLLVSGWYFLSSKLIGYYIEHGF